MVRLVHLFFVVVYGMNRNKSWLDGGLALTLLRRRDQDAVVPNLSITLRASTLVLRIVYGSENVGSSLDVRSSVLGDVLSVVDVSFAEVDDDLAIWLPPMAHQLEVFPSDRLA